MLDLAAFASRFSGSTSEFRDNRSVIVPAASLY
jgi:hypothetical protein